ncbi:hypothetical protein PINS_up018802 [Pythium insidiosum]|nr:hypothetical protein PINS_up018802 [Pythium insidiosum]
MVHRSTMAIPFSGLSSLLNNLKIPSQLLAVGVNCTAPQHVESLLLALETPPETTKLVYPNSGEEWDGLLKVWKPRTHTYEDSWAAYVPKWWSAGARVFGGCCRTSPSDIETIAAICREQLEKTS